MEQGLYSDAAGGAVSAIGDILYSVAIGYWVYETTGASTLIGVMSSISLFITMFVMPFSGTFIDKCDRKAVIIGMDALRGCIMLVVGGLALGERLSVPVVLAAAFLSPLCAVFFDPAANTLLLDIIPHGEMVRGQSMQGGVRSFVTLVGKAFSGMLVAVLGVPLVIVLNGVSFLISALTEAFLAVPRTKRQGERVTVKGVLQDLAQGIGAVFHSPFLRILIPCALILNLLGSGPSSLMLPFVLGKGFGVDIYGYLMSVEMVASLLSMLLLGTVRLKPRQRYYALAVGFLSSGVFFILAYLAENAVVLGVMLFLGTFMNMLGNGIFNASLMLALPEESRGAILGVVYAGSNGGCALSAVIFGVLCDGFPIHMVFVAGMLLSALPMIYLCMQKTTKEFILNN